MTQIYNYESGLSRLARIDYFQTILMTVKIYKDEYWDNEKYRCVRLNTSDGIHCHVASEPRFDGEDIIDGNEYLVSIYNRYHQQSYNLHIIGIHKDMTTGRELYAWDKNFGNRSFEKAYGLAYRTHHI